MTPKQIENSAKLFQEFMLSIGLEPKGGMAETPVRFTKMLCEMTATQGIPMPVTADAIYDPSKEVKIAAFETYGADELVIVRDIEVSSLCEHHFLPFFGKVHICYLPQKRLLGLSKFARIADYFSKRAQTQEYLVADILGEIVKHTEPRFAGVLMEGVHTCMSCRGANKPGSSTVTSKYYADNGCKADYESTKREFLSFIGRK